MEYLRPGRLELAAKLSCCACAVAKSGGWRKPSSRQRSATGRLVPSGGARRAHQHALQSSHHGMTVERVLPTALSDSIPDFAGLFKDCDRLPVLQSKQVLWQKQSGKAQCLRNQASVWKWKATSISRPTRSRAEYFKPSATPHGVPVEGHRELLRRRGRRQAQS